MSILIKDVNLPSGKIDGGKVTGLLIDIPVAAKPTCEVFYETAEGGEDSIGYEIEVVEVPTPHGRLIDAEKLHKDIYHAAFETDTPMQKWDSGCWIRFKLFECAEAEQPTVIKAEE